MIHDAEIIAAIERYFANGGIIHRYPCGYSALSSMLDAHMRHFAFLGWVRRYGAEAGLPPAALECLEAGLITTVQARAPVVWIAVADRAGRATAITIAKDINATVASVRRSLELLEVRRYVESEREPSGIVYRAIGGRVPDWREFMGGVRVRHAA